MFIRGKAISGVTIIIGINQLPNPPIIIGITIKKIIKKACMVTKDIYNSPHNVPLLEELTPLRSVRIIILYPVPIIPDQKPIIKYILPMSLWLVEFNHLFNHTRFLDIINFNLFIVNKIFSYKIYL